MKSWLYDWGGLNVWLFHHINAWHSDFFDRLMLLGTLIGAHENFYLFATVFALSGFIAIYRARMHQLQAQERLRLWFSVLAVFAFAFTLDAAIVTWLKHVLDFPRPLAALPPESVHVVGRAEYRLSLPSGHTVFATLVALAPWPALARPWRVLAILFVVWVGLSRIVLGAHFPADVIAGFVLSLVIALLVRRAVDHLLLRALPPPHGRGHH